MFKKILLSGIIGAVVYFLLGWLAYGILFADKSTGEESMLFIFLGCLFYSFIFSYVFCKLAQISSFKTGFNAGLIIGILFSLCWYFFIISELNARDLIEEIILGGIMSAVLGGVVALVNGKIG
jgi:uncharacterized membrane protein YagU involved in acid resistance